MTEIRTEMLTSAVVLMAMVCLQWLQATGQLGATVAVPNVVQRQSKAIKLDINAHIALAWPHPICGVSGVSINSAFCNSKSTVGVLLKGWCWPRLETMHCKDLVQINKAGQTCFCLWSMLM